ncbi:MAG: hypothetical protein PHR26_04135 [Candidatus ainarchaeum sp.]|nr:hypothetical protein [Candidatus ainarchaeum sp.]MDD3976504.1 hypothetical protein [Candidatus ainarchaeum sp.]
MMILGLGRSGVHIMEKPLKDISDLDIDSKVASYILSFIHIEEKTNIILYTFHNLLYFSTPNFKKFNSLNEFTKKNNLAYSTKISLIYRLFSLVNKEEYNLLKELSEIRNILIHNLYINEIEKIIEGQPSFVKEIISDFKNEENIKKYKLKIIEAYKILNRVEIVISLIYSLNFEEKSRITCELQKLLNKEKITLEEILSKINMNILIKINTEILSEDYKKEIIKLYLSKIKLDEKTLWDKIKDKIDTNK